MDKRAATAAEIATMRGLVEKAMEQGAVGFSTGLIYEPGRYSNTEEVVALASEIAPFGGIYATHMRNEGDRLLEAVEETLHIGKEAGCAVHISHHKAAGRKNWGRVPESLARVDRANAEGMDVTLDVYPYTAGSGPMAQYVNLDHIDVEWAKNVRIASCPAFREFEGKSIPDIAAERDIYVEDAVRLILTAPKGDRTICIHFIIDEADIETNLGHPRMMVGSDGIPNLVGKPHPRLFGTFPRILSTYVRERGVLTLEEAIRRMTSLSCDRFGLVERGLVKEGYWADLVIFDPATVRDLATYDDPQQEPEGIRMVMVNGQVAYEDGQHTGVGAGRSLHYRRV
jgi:N-acyl-D-aspartate/D-glutamate deacylase